MENRKNLRLPIEVASELLISDNALHHCKTKNISFGGICLISEKPLNVVPGNECNVTLLITENKRFNVKFKCVVVHTSVDKKEVGCKYINIRVENYQDFKSFMINRSTDPDRLLDELSKNPGLDMRG